MMMNFNCISRALSEHNIKMVGFLPKKLSSFLQSMKDDLTLKMQGVYSISVSVGKCTVDKLDVCLRQGLMNTIDTPIYTISRSLR
jgi:hypothetical protein